MMSSKGNVGDMVAPRVVCGIGAVVSVLLGFKEEWRTHWSSFKFGR